LERAHVSFQVRCGSTSRRGAERERIGKEKESLLGGVTRPGDGKKVEITLGRTTNTRIKL